MAGLLASAAQVATAEPAYPEAVADAVYPIKSNAR